MSDDISELDSEAARQIGRSYALRTRVVFIVNTDRNFLSHRVTWGLALQAAGARVSVIAEDTGAAATIRRLGFHFIRVAIGRETSSRVLSTGASSAHIAIILLRLRPSTVFLVHQVAYTIGWPAAFFLRKTAFVRVAGGVGRALDSSSLGTFASRVVQASGRLAGRRSNIYTLFQTEHDRNVFERLGMTPNPERSLVIPGTGINIETWSRTEERDFNSPVILFASRLFREKGIYEFIGAAKKLHGRNWRFQVAGEPDPGVETTVTLAEIAYWQREDFVEVLGFRSDMHRVLDEATIFVFPTRHPEGTPKVLIEAGALGLPAVVTSHPGCLEVVDRDVTGVVLHEPSVDELATAIEELALDPEKCAAMGSAARKKIAATFSLQAVVANLLEWEPVKARKRLASNPISRSGKCGSS